MCRYVGRATAQILQHGNHSEMGDQKKSSTNRKSALRTFTIRWIEYCSCRYVGRATAQILHVNHSEVGDQKKVPHIAESNFFFLGGGGFRISAKKLFVPHKI
jgi:hypothetical protein